MSYYICEKNAHCIDCPKNYPEEKCEHWIEVEEVRHAKWITGTRSDKSRCEECFRFGRWNGNPCCSGFGMINESRMKKGCHSFLDRKEVDQNE